METKLTYTFSFTIGDRNYSFNTIASSKEQALELLRKDLASVIAEINLSL